MIYSYAVTWGSAYTRKTYPFQTPGSPEGSGDSANVGLDWKMPHGTRIEWIANDLLGRMRCRDVPGTVTNAGTGVTTTDANGCIVYAPALSGRNARRDFTQKLPVRWGLGAEVPWRDLGEAKAYGGVGRGFLDVLRGVRVATQAVIGAITRCARFVSADNGPLPG